MTTSHLYGMTYTVALRRARESLFNPLNDPSTCIPGSDGLYPAGTPHRHRDHRPGDGHSDPLFRERLEAAEARFGRARDPAVAAGRPDASREGEPEHEPADHG